MNTIPLPRRCAAEALGTALLVATVVGSGIMAERLAAGNTAVALLANTLATGAALAVLILVFGPVSGAHFNPAVTLFERLGERTTTRNAFAYVVAQLAGGVAGTLLANLMFSLPAVALSTHARSGPGQWLGEFVATFGLLLTIAGVSRGRPAAIPFAVAGWIVAAYWFTSSTSFANPAVTLARTLSDTFAGIRPADAPAFVVAQLLAVPAAGAASALLFGKNETPEATRLSL